LASVNVSAQKDKRAEAIVISSSDIEAEVRINDLYFKELKADGYSSSRPILTFLIPGENRIEIKEASIVDEKHFFLDVGVYRTPVGKFADEGEKLVEFKTKSINDLENNTFVINFMVPDNFKTPLQELEPLTKKDMKAAKKLAARIYNKVANNKLSMSDAEDFRFYFKLINSAYPAIGTEAEIAKEFMSEMDDDVFIGKKNGLHFKPYFNGKLLQPLNRNNDHILKFRSDDPTYKSITDEILFIGKYQGKLQVCSVNFITEYLE